MKFSKIFIVLSLSVYTLLSGCSQRPEVGDYFSDGGVEGIVLKTDDSGKPVLLLSLFEANDLDADSALVWGETLDDGWMLPDNEQMTIVRKYRSLINITLERRSLIPVLKGNTYYWTSEASEKSHHYAMGPDGLKPYFHMNHSPAYRARAVREI